MSLRTAPRVLSIDPSAPFLPTLARETLAGRVVPGFAAGGDPLELARLTIFLPTRRAARTLRADFAQALGGGPAILPRLLVLGEENETEAALLSAAGAAPPAPTLGALERRLHLARLVQFWKNELGRAHAALLETGGAAAPASAADALHLAADLASLLDEAEDEEVDLAGLARLGIEDRLAGWWQLTLNFLAIVTQHWPRFLAERSLVSPAALRSALARAAAARYRDEGSTDPVIVAGSTATAPATLELMAAIARLPNGAVVLPGLDRHLDAESFAAIDRSVSLAAAGHPQHGLRRILAGLGAEREEVVALGEAPAPALASRVRFLSEALRPAETTHLWNGAAARHDPAALDGLALLEAADEREEALAIAVAMRHALAGPKRRVALVTPDRNLARRVVVELERFGVAANDSAGTPLLATPPGTLLSLALAVALEPGDPVAILSLLKHPLLRLGLSSGRARRAARTVELVALRGGVGRADARSLATLHADRLAAFDANPPSRPRAVRLLSPEQLEEGAAFAAALEAALAPLFALRAAPQGEIAWLADPVTQALEALARGENGLPDELYAREAGAAIGEFLDELRTAPETGFELLPAELADALRALAADRTVRPRYARSERAFVWGALEARLQSVDTVVLGSLNEGTCPGGARNDAFLSRLMRVEMLLDPPERRIGLAAHDVWMACGTPEVVLARSARSGGAPAIASRWVQRILTLAGEAGAAALRERGTPFLQAARELDRRPEAPRVPRPDPRPPLDVRPARYSVTEVERLIRDPYAVYAHRVLRLEPLEALLRDPGAAERGNLYHAILADFVREAIDPAGPDAETRLVSIARGHFDALALPPEVEAVWWPRLLTLARSYVAWERGRAPNVARRHAEVRGEVPLAAPGTALRGTADRVDEMRDGSLEILDFKTGTSPSVAQARSLLAPQLPLEAAMASLGGFERETGIGRDRAVSELTFVRLRERAFIPETLSQPGGRGGEPVGASELAGNALARFRELAAAYRNEGRGFLSRARPYLAADLTGPYDHLARAAEWIVATDEGEGSPE